MRVRRIDNTRAAGMLWLGVTLAACGGGGGGGGGGANDAGPGGFSSCPMAFKASCETKMVDINTGKILQHTCLEDYTTADNEVFASGIEGPGCTSANNPANGEYATAGSGCSTAMLSSGCGTFVAGAPECQVSWIYSDDPTASTEPASCSTNGGTVVNP